MVASEVKSLANQTGNEQRKRSALKIGADPGRHEGGGQGDSGASPPRCIEEVSAIATAIASAVEQQGAATSEITARNVQQTTRRRRTVSCRDQRRRPGGE